MTSIKERVKIKVGEKVYDLKPSGNPHSDLPKNVIKALQDGGHLVDDLPVVKATTGAGDAELAAANEEIKRLTEESASLAKDVEQLTADNAALQAQLEELKAASGGAEIKDEKGGK